MAATSVAWAVLFASWIALENPVFAAPPPARLVVRFDFAECSQLPREEILRIASLELGVPTVPTVPTVPGASTATGEVGPVQAATYVVLTCSAPTVNIAVRDSLTAKELIRHIDLPAGRGEAVARLVAIGAAELVLTSWMELTLEGTADSSRATDTPPHSAEPLSSPELRRAARELVERRHSTPAEGGPYAFALVQGAGTFEGAGWGWGGGLRAGWATAHRWLARESGYVVPLVDLELSTTRSRVDRTLGSVRASLWSVALRGCVRVVRPTLFADFGVGGRVGLAFLRGAPTDAMTARGATTAGTWIEPIAFVAAGTRTGHLLIAAGIEGGYVARTVSGLVDGEGAVSLSGFSIAGTLGVGWGRQ